MAKEAADVKRVRRSPRAARTRDVSPTYKNGVFGPHHRRLPGWPIICSRAKVTLTRQARRSRLLALEGLLLVASQKTFLVAT
jgi:hypothetical protein